MASIIGTTTVLEDGSIVIMARIKNTSGGNLTQAGTSGIVYTVTDMSTSTPVTGHNAAALTIGTVIFDTLQTDSLWTLDSIGYNFKHVLAATAVPDGAKTYEYDCDVTHTTGAISPVVVHLATVNRLKS